MKTIISKSEFAEYDKKSKVELKDLFIRIYKTIDEESVFSYVPLNELYYTEMNGEKPKKFKSYSEYDKISKKKGAKIFSEATGTQEITFEPDGAKEKPDLNVKIKDMPVPEHFESIEINTEKENVPYGLKRTLKVKEASADVSEKYYYVEINGKKEFLKASEIYYINNLNKKVTIDKVKDLGKIEAFYSSKTGQQITKIYAEKQFIFDQITQKEVVDFSKGIKYELKLQVSESGEFTYKHIGTDRPVEKYFSEQKYIKKEVEDERKPGEMKEKSFIEVKNFVYNPEGDYFALTINNATKMVKMSNLFDEKGKEVTNLKDMIGKRLNVKIDGEIVGTTAPLTFEQAHMAYESIKTFQETEKTVDENSYLRLKNGEYVKELETVQPVAFKLATAKDNNFDAYLVKKVGDDGITRFVIVSKDYFEKYGNTGEFKLENAMKVKRCEVNDKDCIVIQTTSKNQEVEQCSIIKKFKFNSSNVEPEQNAKETAMQGFMTGYLAGEYLIKDVYHNGNLEELSARRQRYELTDTSLLEDYADNHHQYRSLKINEMKIVNGKMVGGPKFDAGKGIKNSYATLGRIVVDNIGLVMMGSLFTIAIGGPFVGAALVAMAVAAVPLIPIVNLVHAWRVNRQKNKFLDKSEINRKQQAKDLDLRMQKLYERMTSKEYLPYPEARFEDEYSKLINDIISLSAGSVENRLIVKDGVAEITPENASAVKAYMTEFNAVAEQLKQATETEEKAHKNFSKLEEKMKVFEEEGKVVPEKFQKKYDKAKLAYDSARAQKSQLKNRHEALMNYEGNPTQMQAYAERDRMLKVAEMMHTAVYFKSETFKDHPLVNEAINELQNSSDVITSVDLASYVVNEEDLGLTEEDKANIIEEEISKLTKEEQEKLSDEDKENLLALKVNEMLYEKRSQLSYDQVMAKINEKGLTEMVVDDLVLDSKDKKLQSRFENAHGVTPDLTHYVVNAEDLDLSEEDKEKIIEKAIKKLPRKERKQVNEERKQELLQNGIDELVQEKRSQMSEAEAVQLIEERNLTKQVMSDLTLSSSDKKQQQAFAKCKTLEEKLEMIRDEAYSPEKILEAKVKIIRENESIKSKKMLDNMEMDFRNGLMVDGMGVGLQYEKDLRENMSDYGRSHRWEKVKQAIEKVHYGLKGEEPVVEEEQEPTEEKPEEPKETPKKEIDKKPKKLKDANMIISAENNLCSALEDNNKNDVYKFVVRKLSAKKKDGTSLMTKEEASQFIFDLTLKIGDAHNKGVPALAMFEKGTLEHDIIKSAIKKHGNIIKNPLNLDL